MRLLSGAWFLWSYCCCSSFDNKDRQMCMWFNMLLAYWATVQCVQLTVIHLCEKPLASSWLLRGLLPDLCSLCQHLFYTVYCQHPAGSMCVTACQQVARRPVFVLHTHTHTDTHLSTPCTPDKPKACRHAHTHTANKERWCHPAGSWRQRAPVYLGLRLFVFSLMSLLVLSWAYILRSLSFLIFPPSKP